MNDCHAVFWVFVEYLSAWLLAFCMAVHRELPVAHLAGQVTIWYATFLVYEFILDSVWTTENGW